MSEGEKVAVQRFKSQLFDELGVDLRRAVATGSIGQQQASAVEAAARGALSTVQSAPELKHALNQLRQRWPSLEVLEKFVAKKVFSLAALDFIAENEEEVLSDIRAINDRARRNAAALPLDHTFEAEQLGLWVLFGIFESVLLRPSFNQDYKLRVEDGQVGCWTSVVQGEIRFMGWYDVRPSVSAELRAKYANLVNVHQRTMKASVDDDGDLLFQWVLPASGGATKRQIAATAKSFLESLRASLLMVDDILAN